MTRAAPVHPLELISAQIDGEITPGETRFLEAHLRACSSCQKKRVELSSIAAGLHDLPVGPPAERAVDRLLTRLHQQKHPVRLLPPAPVAVPEQVQVAPRPERRAPWIPLGTAAVTLAAVFLYFRAGVPMDRTVVADPVSTAIEAPASPVPASAAAPAPIPLVSEAPSRSVRPAVAPAPAAPAPIVQAPVAQATVVQAPEILQPATREVVPEPTAKSAVLPEILFKANSKRLSHEARELVASVAEFLRQHKDVKLTIRGHAEERRSAEKSLALAEKRARVVAGYLESLGIDPSRLQPAPAGNGNNRVVLAVKR